MAGGSRTLNYRVAVDAASAESGVRSFSRTISREMKNVEQSFDETSSAGKRVADVMGQLADEARTELAQAGRAADALGRALGPELSAKLGANGIAEYVGDLTKLGLTFDQIEADADALAGGIRELDAVKTDALDQGLGNLGGKLGEVNSMGGQTKSVLANMVGNSTQDIAGLSGITGSLGVALGQVGEYATEGGVTLGGFAKIAGPMAGLALVTQGVGAYLEGIAKTKAFRSDLVDQYTDSIREAHSMAQTLYDTLKQTGDIEYSQKMEGGFLGLGSSVESVLPLIEELGLTWEQFVSDVSDPAAKSRINAMTEEMVFQGDEAEHAAVKWNDYAGAVDQIGGAWRDAEANQRLGADLTKQAAEATGDAAAETRDYEAALQASNDRIAEHAAALEGVYTAMRGLADSGIAQREAQREFNETLATSNETLGNTESTADDAAAALDDAASSAGRVADAAVRIADETAAANGVTLNAESRQRAWNAAMVGSARQAEGPLRDAIIDYMATANQIPREKITDILADPNYASIDLAAVAIGRLAAPVTAPIDVDDQGTASATGRDIDYAARPRHTTITATMQAARNLVVPPGASGYALPPAEAVPAARALEGPEQYDDEGFTPLLGPAGFGFTMPAVPAAAPVAVTVDLRGALLAGSRYQLVRTVRDAAAAGARLAGNRT